MKKSKIFALIANLIFTAFVLIALAGFWFIFLMRNSSAVIQDVQDAGLEMNMLVSALIIAAGVLILLVILNWIAFIRFHHSRGWRLYLLIVGISYGLASLFNGAGLLITLPIAICLVLSYVFKQQEIKVEK